MVRQFNGVHSRIGLRGTGQALSLGALGGSPAAPGLALLDLAAASSWPLTLVC
jgi:hypothetical protein